MIEFDEELFRSAPESTPFRYGSYYILEANNKSKSFKTATFINTTSQDASAYFP